MIPAYVPSENVIVCYKYEDEHGVKKERCINSYWLENGRSVQVGDSIQFNSNAIKKIASVTRNTFNMIAIDIQPNLQPRPNIRVNGIRFLIGPRV